MLVLEVGELNCVFVVEIKSFDNDNDCNCDCDCDCDCDNEDDDDDNCDDDDDDDNDFDNVLYVEGDVDKANVVVDKADVVGKEHLDGLLQSHGSAQFWKKQLKSRDISEYN